LDQQSPLFSDCPPLAFGPIREMLAAIWNARGAVDLETRLAQLAGWVASQPFREDLRKAITSSDIR
jgi:hypothetical protein